MNIVILKLLDILTMRLWPPGQWDYISKNAVKLFLKSEISCTMARIIPFDIIKIKDPTRVIISYEMYLMSLWPIK